MQTLKEFDSTREHTVFEYERWVGVWGHDPNVHLLTDKGRLETMTGCDFTTPLRNNHPEAFSLLFLADGVPGMGSNSARTSSRCVRPYRKGSKCRRTGTLSAPRGMPMDGSTPKTSTPFTGTLRTPATHVSNLPLRSFFRSSFNLTWLV